MFRAELPRLYELRDLIADPSSKNAYFQNFEDRLRDSPHHVMRIYSDWEKDLDAMDDTAWLSLKTEAAPRLMARHSNRGWEQLFDIFNQARAYNYLRRIGCARIGFIPRSGQRTPDLEATLGSESILCEVKTLNRSLDSILALRQIKVRDGMQTDLGGGFFNKLQYHITQAEAQMDEYDPHCRSRHIVYICPLWDEFFGECKHLYFRQIDEYLMTHPPSAEVVIYNARTAFHQPIAMRAATVDNAE
jgi:hypothetical protein